MTDCQISARVRRFAGAEDGTQLVEFAILLPMLLLVFAVIVEGGRLMWSYQATGAGVRDATRYLARVLPEDYCSTSGSSVEDWEDAVVDIVRDSKSGDAIFPTGITIDAVTPVIICVTGGYRLPKVAVAQVTADLTVTFPFHTVFEFLGSSRPTIETTISDQSRVFGT